MYYAFELSSQRRIVEANYNTFVNPLLHPNRVMQLHDFLYILDGDWEIALEYDEDCKIFPVRKDDLIILPAQVHHYGTQLCSPNSRNMYLHVEPLPGDFAVGQAGCREIGENVVLLPTVIHCGSNIEINRYFSEMIAVCWKDTLHKSNRLSCLFDLLLCEISEQESATVINSKCGAFVNEIAHFLRSNPEIFYSVSDIARQFYVSEKTLNKRFKTVYNRTFYAWQMDQKLDMVYQSLHNNADITLKETAVNFGFYDEFHLSRAFKKKFGVAPKYVR
ncbi:MAG: helix-turn-helix transcriptional regulator [Lachnospiraceae bacterium]|nr:helix-turn-helix transcriptional regulator [Lachnospiraceae bacterium]MDE7271818.1 helix-turn-helix transcriptional regulator [Lachnospiraceae bacterium]